MKIENLIIKLFVLAGCWLGILFLWSDSGVAAAGSGDGSVVKLSGDQFKEKTARGLVMVDFFSPTCGPCKMMAPLVHELAAEMKGKATIAEANVFDNQSTAQSMQISGVPTFVIFKNGKEVDRIVGGCAKSELADAILRHAN